MVRLAHPTPRPDPVIQLRGREVTIARDGVDRYGRTLARLGDTGETLISEGLAHRWPSRKGWC